MHNAHLIYQVLVAPILRKTREKRFYTLSYKVKIVVCNEYVK